MIFAVLTYEYKSPLTCI